MQRHLGLVHKEHVRQVVLHQYREQDNQDLLFATRQTIGQQHLTNLCELQFVRCTDNLLACIAEQLVDDVLEPCLLLRHLLGGFSITSLELLDDAVADVHLIIQVFALQLEQLHVEQRSSSYACQRCHGLGQEPGILRECLLQIGVQRAYQVVADPLGILGLHLQMHALQHVRGELATSCQSLHHLVQDGTLTRTVRTAQDIHLTVQFPYDMLLPAPERVDLYSFDVISILRHSVGLFLVVLILS